MADLDWEVFQRCRDLQKVTKIKGLSQEALARLQRDSFDFICIDGAHEAKFVIQDAVLAHRLLRLGGWLLFDDYPYRCADRCRDTARAIDFF